MYRKNVSGQFVYFCLVNASTGAALTGATVTAYRALDNGSQATATGTTTELANGQYRFNLSQADTNGNYGSYLFVATNAVPVEKTVVFTAANPQDAAAFGLSTINLIDNNVDAVNSVVNSIDQRLPAALVSGRIDAHVGAMAANTLTASALATDAVNEIVGAVFAYSVSQDDFFTVMGNLDNLQTNLAFMLELDGNVHRWTANALEQAPAGGDASQATLLQVKAKTDLITANTIYTTVDRVYGSTITTYLNESTSINVPLQEDTTSKTLRFVVENADALDVLVIENANITRTASQFTVTITTAVTATLGQYKWSLRDITGGINRVVQIGVLQVVGAANKDA